jgi:electron transfer flavoprotein alpha/beta subunit
MSLKVYDSHGRWRNKTVAFRISPEEDSLLETAVALSGLTKQDYIIRRLQCRDVVVVGNPRVYKALRNQLAAVLDELKQINDSENINADLLDTIRLIAVTMGGLQYE